MPVNFDQIWLKFLHDLAAGLYPSGAASGTASITPTTFGAVGDGTHDDTSAIQAAIDAAPSGGIIELPPGRFKITAPLVITRPLTIQGAGAGSTNTDIFGSVGWASVLETGTVLESTQTSGSVISFVPAPTYPLNLRDLVIKGLGDATRTTVGVTLDANRSEWHNVILLNLYRGLSTSGEADDNSFTNLWVCGCDIGVSLNGTVTNQNTFYQLNGSACNTGVSIGTGGGVKNAFYGGVLQGNKVWGIDIAVGEENSFYDFYLENAAASGGGIRVVSGDGNVFLRTHLSAGDNVLFSSNGNVLEIAKYSPTTVTFAAGTSRNQLIGTPTGTFTDSGLGNWRIRRLAGGDDYTFSPAQGGTVTLTGGTLMSLPMKTAGGLNVGLQVRDDLTEARWLDGVNNFSFVRAVPNAAGGRIGFYNVGPVARQLLATGTGATVDQVITALQTLGLLRQS